ncbi:PilW family protein [Alishewanella sp. HL-SH06]|uniref:PilW family protein n=1 Tax=Alishewanella sp. HL-SH06 TaxID=3461144 RepID=UPI0040436A2C
MIRREAGFSLVELLIAAALALMLLLLMLTTFTALNQSSTQTRQLAQLQQNGQLVLNLLHNELKNTGFWGGLPQQQLAEAATLPLPAGDCVVEGLDSGSFPMSGQSFLTLYAARATGGRQLGCLNNLIRDTEFLQLKRSIGLIVAPDEMRANRFYWQADWQQGRFVAVDAAQLNAGMLFPYQHLVFYLQQQNQNGQTIPVLMRKRLVRNAAGAASISTDSIIDGVERLHFEFMIDSDLDGRPNFSLASHQMTVEHWLQQQSRIVGLQYHVLLRSLEPDHHYNNTQQYQLGSIQFEAPGDAYRRLQLSGAVYFENAVLAEQ